VFNQSSGYGRKDLVSLKGENILFPLFTPKLAKF
jgi:hypothetical protein